MSEVTGFIDFINERQTSFGAMYDIKVNGTNYGVGKFKPKNVDKGDYVKFTAEQKGKYFNVKAGSLQKLDKPAGVAAPKVNVNAGYGGDARQTIISKQSALNTSIAFVKVLQEGGFLPLPAKLAKDKAADLVEKMTLEYAAKFYHLSTGETFEIPEDTSILGDLSSVEEAGNWQE